MNDKTSVLGRSREPANSFYHKIPFFTSSLPHVFQATVRTVFEWFFYTLSSPSLFYIYLPRHICWSQFIFLIDISTHLIMTMYGVLLPFVYIHTVDDLLRVCLGMQVHTYEFISVWRVCARPACVTAEPPAQQAHFFFICP